MEWFSAPDYQVARLVLERGLGVVYVVAFLVALNQFPALLGEQGLLPAPRYIARVGFRQAPSLFHLHYSDRFFRAASGLGLGLAAATVLGLPQAGPLWLPVLCWLVLYLLYLSIVNIGQIFYGFGWESLLLEAGFLAIFLGNAATAPAFPVLLLFRWLAVRVELGAGLIKLRGDPCWRDLTCMDYHHETQPMPNPLSWYFHRLPRVVHRLEVVGNYVAQLGAPFLLFFPQPIAGIGALLMIGTQAYLVISGNYAWLNVVTMLTAFSALPDGFFRRIVPVASGSIVSSPPGWYLGAVLGLTLFVVVLSYWPVRNLVGRRQLMNFAFNRFHLVGTYGAFGSVTRKRYEVILEGTADAEPALDSAWKAYEFKGKPGDPRRRPPQIAPYHLRLDWMMWFAALSPQYAESWFGPLVQGLLAGHRPALALLRHDPFGGTPPVWIRATYWHYRFATRAERSSSGVWWVRDPVGEFLRPMTLARREAR